MSTNIEKLAELSDLPEWLAQSGPLTSVTIRHDRLVQQQAGTPLPNQKRSALLSPTARAQLEAAMAVERTIYHGIKSRYALSRAEDRDALLGGLMNGFRFDDLRITDESIQRCVEADQWRIEGCEFFEFRAGTWRDLDTAIQAAAVGKADGDNDVTIFFPVPLRPSSVPPLLSPCGFVGDLLGHLERAGLVSQPEADGLMAVIVHAQERAVSLTIDTAADSQLVAQIIAAQMGCTIPTARPELVPFLPLVMWPEGPDGAAAFEPGLQYERA